MKDIQKIEERTYRYWYEDGIGDMGLGLIFALLGVMFLIEGLAPAGPLQGMSAILLPAVVIAGGLVARRLVSAAKERITYPRTGYVEYRKPSRNRRGLSALVAMVMGALVALFVATSPMSQRFIPLFTGVVIGAGFLYIGNKFSLGRYLALAATSTLAGAAGSYIMSNSSLGDGIYFCVTAIALALSGSVTFTRYLQGTGSSGVENGRA